LTHVFFLYFLLWGWFFFLILSYGIKLLTLELCDFFQFFFLGYPKCGLVKLAWASLSILFFNIFLYKYGFFAKSSFWKSFFFIIISCRGWRVNWVNLGSLEFFYPLASFPWHWFFLKKIITWRWNVGHWPLLFLALLSIKLLWERVSKFNLD
jgi:hypothetical protein